MEVDFSRSYRLRWRRGDERLVLDVAEVESDVEPTGLVVLSVEAVCQLLLDAGWERVDGRLR